MVLLFVTVFAIGACIFTAFFPVNETKELVTISSKIHGIGSIVGFLLFLFVPLLLAVLEFRQKNLLFSIAAAISLLLTLLFFVLFVMSDKPAFSSTIISYEGLWQRLSLLFMYLPFGLIAVTNIL